jgi:hypothetical protein
LARGSGFAKLYFMLEMSCCNLSIPAQLQHPDLVLAAGSARSQAVEARQSLAAMRRDRGSLDETLGCHAASLYANKLSSLGEQNNGLMIIVAVTVFGLGWQQYGAKRCCTTVAVRTAWLAVPALLVAVG